MAQLLIVEGKDAIAIANLLMFRGLPAPKGYENSVEFRAKFVKVAGNDDQALIALKIALEDSSLSNIGIIIDANNIGPHSRWESLRNIIIEKGFAQLISDQIPSPTGIVLNDPNLLTLGIWIMPDNQSDGYLEHFLTSLIDEADPLWQYVEESIQGLAERNLQRFSTVKTQKATIHTWLAWQSEPGKPFGQALSMGYLDARSVAANNFETWFRNTFELSA